MTEREIFIAALHRTDPAERAAFLDGACGEDRDLRGRVEALLREQEQLGSFLEQPAGGPAGTGAFSPGQGDGDATTPAEQPGTVIGPYKLLEEIGAGGMGAVWMAQQTAPVKRLVALKVIRPGMDSRQVIARFEAERQALALMDHPNIAKVLDAGTTPAGRPYFVMELVKGVPLTRYCDEHRLMPRQRLELFVPVCQAVQHAHHKGVIHRDLKPSNILVAQYDGQPVPKVIDFGIAKAAGQPLTEHTLVTGFGAIVGTLEYMSPEQAELNQLDIDTRSDVYSLGVLLYELLTGSTPLEKKRLKEAALLEVLRLIREEEPPRPSTRLSTADELPSVAANRGLEPKMLSGVVHGELDWVVMKALEKNRNRRYESASAFAADVQRYLADEPVLACPPSAWYRFRKLARRNKGRLAFAASTCLLAAVTLASVGWALRDRAVREQTKQQEEATRQARAANDQELALASAELYQREGKRPEALAAVGRAELLARQAPHDPDRDARLAAVKERLKAAALDEEFLARFEDIILRAKSQMDYTRGHFTSNAPFPEIRDAFGRYGIPIGVMAPAQAAGRIRGRPEAVRRTLVAALDEYMRWVRATDPQRPWLLAVLEAADGDAWRARVRRAVSRSDWAALERLAREVDAPRQPPTFLLQVKGLFPPPDESSPAGPAAADPACPPGGFMGQLRVGA